MTIEQLLAHWPDPAIVVDEQGVLFAVSPMANVLLCDIQSKVGEYAHDVLCVEARQFRHEKNQCPFHALQPNASQKDSASSAHVMTPAEWVSTYWCALSGEYLCVDIRANALTDPFEHLTVWSFIDNSSQRHNQAELQRFAQFVDMSPAPIAEFDRFGQLMFANGALQNLMIEAGYNSAGQSCVIPPHLEAICAQCINANTMEAGQIVSVAFGCHFFEWHFHSLLLETYSLSTDTAQEDNYRVLGFAFDVTQQKEAKASLVKAQREARRDFYAKMIHELRTPLNAIMGFSDILLQRISAKLSPREIQNLQAIKNAGFQLNELVSDTLDIAKVEAGHMAIDIDNFDFYELCASFLPQIEALAYAKRLAFYVEITHSLFIQSDKQKVRQILINLLSNAIKYTQSGWVKLHAELQNDFLVISVSDSGIGIPEQQIDKLFKNYQQIDEINNKDIQGKGLGLALVQELVTLLGAQITVSSEYQKGSLFVVKLPVN